MKTIEKNEYDMYSNKNISETTCHLIGGRFDDMIQILLGLIALSVLIMKRYTESPPRPFQIWAFDASKQGIGAIFAHIFNLAIAIILTQISKRDNLLIDECAFYFVNFTVDTTFGILLNWFFLHLLTSTAKKKNWSRLINPGDYGHPIEIFTWLYQLLSWLFIISFTKLLLAIGIYMFNRPFGKLSSWLFSPIKNYPRIELIIVMVICPCLMNGAQFWIQDNFLKKKETNSISLKNMANLTENETIINVKVKQEKNSIKNKKFADEEEYLKRTEENEKLDIESFSNQIPI